MEKAAEVGGDASSVAIDLNCRKSETEAAASGD
uniref:Uncharacterized protein n=1 Tax=Arundo donax TaxID=35708 RepID=A0A0A9GJE2_ARUDO